ncbi:PEP-CTERM sorting domain-containing protein [bacterium]|nr:MAG: PEP-CTERM sorting domain-containing protein [bacterium]
MVRALLSVLILAAIAGTSNAQNVAYISANPESGPWGSQAYRNDFNTVFGESGWRESTFATADTSLFDPKETSLLVIEGGDWMADEMFGYLTQNSDALQKFVYDGGRLIINAAPNTGENIPMFGGGVGLSYNRGTDYNYTATPIDFTHPVFAGPYGKVQSLEGNYAGHATVYDNTGLFQPLLTGENGGTMLAQASYGSGFALLGGLTTPWAENNAFDSGQWRSFNQNMLAYAGGGDYSATQAVPEPASLTAIGLGAMALIRRRRAKKA